MAWQSAKPFMWFILHVHTLTMRFIKILFPCSVLILPLSNTKDKPKKNQGTTYLLPILKKCCLLSEGVRWNALRVLRPKSPHFED